MWGSETRTDVSGMYHSRGRQADPLDLYTYHKIVKEILEIEYIQNENKNEDIWTFYFNS